MILVDERTGSKDLMVYLEDATLTRLDFGDAMLTGHGPDNSSITVGVELKKVSDLLSSISTGRLGGHQLPGMLKSYDHTCLMFYGACRPGPDNLLQVRRGKAWQTYRVGRRSVPWSYLEGALLTYQMIGGVRVKHVFDLREAAIWLTILDRWLDKPWDKHRGMAVFDKSHENSPPPDCDPVEAQIARTASSFPAIDWVRGWTAARYFESVAEMIGASAAEWQEVDGIGKVIAASVRRAIHTRKNK